jgi:WD40 repeat protein
VIQTRQVRDDNDQDLSGADYILEKQIGKGGMGLVLRAHQSSVGRKVALKSMLPQFAEAGSERVKFVTEAVVTAAMDHPNVVPIYDLGVNEDGSLFYVMKEIEGTPWNDCIRDKSLAENLDILLRMGDAMAYAHARNYIHRDLKPENIMVGSFGEVLVMDWGLAVSVQEPESWNLAGTPAYMAPEMASHPVEGLGFHSDIYLMGAILYEILTGSPAHAGEDVMDCVRNAARNQLVETDIDNELIDIARTAMATEVVDRYGSIIEFQHAVREYQTHAESVAMSDRAAEQLTLARQNDDYESYAQARFGFHEATTIWPENEQAQSGQREALLGHAQCALAKEDFGLGLSLLVEFQDAPVELLRDLQRGQNQRERARKVKAVMVGGLVLLTIVAAGVGSLAYFKQIEAERERKKAVEQTAVAQEQRRVAKTNERAATEQKGIADRQTVAAQKSARKAIRQEKEAKKQKTIAEGQQAKAEASAYRATVGQVAALIESNEFQTARRGLDQLKASGTERGWEWARLDYLASLARSNTTFAQPLAAVAWSNAGLLAVADSGGQVTLCPAENPNRDQQILQLHKGTGLQVLDLAFSPAGGQLAIVGSRRAGAKVEGLLEVWDVLSGQLLVEMPQPPAASLTTCRYLATGDQKHLLVGTEAGQLLCLQGADLVRIEAVETGGAIEQLDIVDRTSANEPPLVVACGADGVGLWEFVDEGPSSRFRSLGKFREHTGRVSAVVARTIKLSDSQQDVLIVSAGVDRSGLGQVLLWVLSDWREMLVREQTLSGLALRAPGGAAGSSTLGQTARKSPQLLRLSLAAEMRSLELKRSSLGRHADGESQSMHLLLAGNENTLHQRTLEIRSRSAVQSESESGAGDWETTGTGSWSIVESSQKLLRGHEKPLSQVLFEPHEDDWRQVVTISADRTLKMWDLASYEEERVARLLQSEQAIFSSTAVVGERVFAATQTGHLWEWPYLESADQPQRYFEGHQFLARHVAVIQSDEERLLLTTSRDQSANLWNLGTQSQVRYWERFCGPLGLVAASPDSRQVITDAPSREVREADGAGKDASTQAFPVYRWRLVGRDAELKGAEEVAQMSTVPEVLQTPHRARITGIVFSPDSQLFATVDADGVVYLWDAGRTPQAVPLRRIPASSQPLASIDDVCFYGNDTLMLALSNGTIHEYRVEGGAFVRVLPRPRKVDGEGWEVVRVHLAVGPQSDRMAAQVTEVRELAEEDGPNEPAQDQRFVYRYSVWSWSGPRDVAVLVAPAAERFMTPPTRIVYSPTGDLLATVQGPRFYNAKRIGSPGQTLRVWPAVETPDRVSREFRLQRQRKGAPAIESIVLLDRAHLVTVGRRSAIGWRMPVGKQALDTGGEQAETLAATEEFALEPQGAAHAIAASPDNRFLVTANEEGTATLWETASARVAGRLVPRSETQGFRPASIQAVAFATPHVAGKPYQLATGDSRGGLRIWQIDAAQNVQQWQVRWATDAPVEDISALAWHDQRLVVGTEGGAVYLFNNPKVSPAEPSSEVILELDASQPIGLESSDRAQRVTALVFDPSGQYLAVAQEFSAQISGNQTRLRIYKIFSSVGESTEMVLHRSLQGHSQAINCAAFLGRGPGSRLATGSRDGSVKIWQWDYTEMPPEPVTELPPEPATGTTPVVTLQMVNELLSLRAHQGEVSSLNFSEANNALISSGADGRIIVWEASRPAGRTGE